MTGVFLIFDSEDVKVQNNLTEHYSYLIKPFCAEELKFAIELAIYKNKIKNELKDQKIIIKRFLNTQEPQP
jgi:hypothetical protein